VAHPSARLSRDRADGYPDRIAGNWKLFKGKVQKQWGKLTHDDIALANGRREELAGRIQARYGIDKAQADRQIDAWVKAQK
jgi:uncharacterized protein YjbJ (UPF0337 family)